LLLLYVRQVDELETPNTTTRGFFFFFFVFSFGSVHSTPRDFHEVTTERRRMKENNPPR